MKEYDKILPITEVKKDLLGLVKDISSFQTSIAITKKGHPTAVLLSIDEYEGLLETIEILSNPDLLNAIKKSKKEIDSGKFVKHEDIWD